MSYLDQILGEEIPSTPLEAALYYAALGWFVFPVAPRDKQPLTAHGHRDAITDADQIRAWWTKTPSAGIGVWLRASGLIAIDADNAEGLAHRDALELVHGPLPRQLHQRTKRGEHILMRDPFFDRTVDHHATVRVSNVIGNLGGAGCVDIKCNGYVLLYPSPGKTWITFEDPRNPPALPEPWRALIGRAPSAITDTPAPVMSGELAARVTAGREQLAAFVATQPDHKFNGLIRDALAGRGGGECNTGHMRSGNLGYAIGLAAPTIGADAAAELARVALDDVARRASNSRGDLQQRLEESYSDGAAKQTADLAADAVHLAKLDDTQPATGPAPSEFQKAYELALAQVRAALEAPTSAGELAPLFEPATELLKRHYPKATWLVQGLLKRGGVGLIGGEPKTGKTWALLELALAIASGTKAFGEFETGTPRPTAYFFAEDLGPDVQHHLRALAVGRGMSPELAVANLHAEPRGRFIDIQRPEDLALIIASCRKIPGLALLCLDPLRDIHGAEENASDGMRLVMRNLRVIGELLDCTVAVPHHLNKGGEGKRGGQRMRGSSAIHGSTDSGLYLSGLESTGDRISNTVEVEIKGARGAGNFDLVLDIVDGPDGTSERASWRVARGTERALPGAQEEDLGRVADAIQQLEARHEQPSGDRIRVTAKLGKTALALALKALETRGLIARRYQGRKMSGYELTAAGRSFVNGRTVLTAV